MALITRLTRLLRADLNAVMDRIEEPDILLAQAVREMEAAVAEDQSTLAALRQEQTGLAGRCRDLAQSLEGIGEELDVCLEADADDLARALLRRRIEAGRGARQLEARRAALTERINALSERIATRQRQLAETRARAALALAERRGAATPPPAWTDSVGEVTDADVEIALLAEKRRRGSA